MRMDDAELLKAFESLTLPFDQWAHRSHVRVGYLYLRASATFEDALVRMRMGVKRFNAAHHVPETPHRGYNETTTHAFLHLIAATMRAYGETHPAATSDAFCDVHPQLMTRDVLRLFYSPQRRMDPGAKTRFVEPDLSPLPKIPSD
jgi:hypothetical protein